MIETSIQTFLAAESAADPTESLGFLDLIILFSHHNKALLRFLAAAAVLTSIYAFLLVTPEFESQATIMPPQQSRSGLSFSMSQLGGLSGLAGGSGLTLKDPNDIYIAMLRSRTVLADIATKFNLKAVYAKAQTDETLHELLDHSKMTSEKGGVISVLVRDVSPQRAAEMANAYVDSLKRVSNSLASTEAADRQRLFEAQLKRSRQDLADAENGMQEFQQKSGVVQMDAAGKMTVETIAGLRAQLTASQLQLNVVKTYATPDNPEYKRMESAIATLQGQIAQAERGADDGTLVTKLHLPGAGMEYLRRLRTLRYQESLFELLSKQYETAKFDGLREATTIEILDQAVPADHKARPRRLFLMIIGLCCGLFLWVLYVIAAEATARAQRDPFTAERLNELRRLWRINPSVTVN